MAPINGMYGIEGADGSVSVWNSGELFGAIDVALFILVIGGFLGVTMKTGAIQNGIGRIVSRLKGRERLDDPDPDDRLRRRRHDVRDGRGEPGVLCADHHRDDRGRLRLPGRGVDRPAGLRDRRARLDRSTRSPPASPPNSRASRSTRASSAVSSSSSSARSSASSSSCATPRGSRPIRRRRWSPHRRPTTRQQFRSRRRRALGHERDDRATEGGPRPVLRRVRWS